ncbi:MAG TPA: kynureninase [Acidimicrobiia bacterium]|nr:kynureninase [Acidimicrobiia bacterium]
MLDRAHFEALDEDDPLAYVAGRFVLPEGIVYLDGNSLGPLPAPVPATTARMVEQQWGEGLIRSWNDNGWWDLARRVGRRIAPLLGAPPDSVIAGDTTSVALYKAVSAARRLVPDRSVILTDRGNFPTDLYVLDSVAEQTGGTLEMVAPAAIEERLADDVAVLALTHVDYRSGRRHPLAELTEAAHGVGALAVWDLSHSVGAMNLDVSDADMAVGCGYKYLNGGPGAPAFTYVNPRHHGKFDNPIHGWWGHADPFAMNLSFRAAEGIGRVQVGTQPIISLAALYAALEVFDDVDPKALRTKSERLVDGFITLVDQQLEGFEVVTPRSPEERGSHVSLSHPQAADIMAALIARGVIGDVRPPDLLRFGLAPAYLRYVDVWDCVDGIRQVMEEEGWKRARARSGPVT